MRLGWYEVKSLIKDFIELTDFVFKEEKSRFISPLKIDGSFSSERFRLDKTVIFSHNGVVLEQGGEIMSIIHLLEYRGVPKAEVMKYLDTLAKNGLPFKRKEGKVFKIPGYLKPQKKEVFLQSQRDCPVFLGTEEGKKNCIRYLYSRCLYFNPASLGWVARSTKDYTQIKVPLLYPENSFFLFKIYEDKKLRNSYRVYNKGISLYAVPSEARTAPSDVQVILVEGVEDALAMTHIYRKMPDLWERILEYWGVLLAPPKQPYLFFSSLGSANFKKISLLKPRWLLLPDNDKVKEVSSYSSRCLPGVPRPATDPADLMML